MISKYENWLQNAFRLTQTAYSSILRKILTHLKVNAWQSGKSEQGFSYVVYTLAFLGDPLKFHSYSEFLRDVDKSKLEVTVELEDVLVKLNKVSNPAQGLLHVQVGQISISIFRLVSLLTNKFIWDFQKILRISQN